MGFSLNVGVLVPFGFVGSPFSGAQGRFCPKAWCHVGVIRIVMKGGKE
jgi:hypothetical protein